MKNLKNNLLLVSISLMVVFLLGCSVKTKEPTTTQIITQQMTTITTQTVSNLDNTSWVLKALGDINDMTSVIGSGYIFLEFKNNSTYYGGNIGTFLYGGQMSVQENTINFGLMTSTPITIPDNPPGFQQQAHNYLALLRNAKTYILDGGELLLSCGNGQAIIFTKYTTN